MRKVTVEVLLSGRYLSVGTDEIVTEWVNGEREFIPSQHLITPTFRPDSWDQRSEGIDIIRTTDGEVVKLLSDGMQSSPKPGWVLMLRNGDPADGMRWTLYGIPQQAC